MIISYLVIIGILMIISGFFLMLAARFYGAGNQKRKDDYSLKSSPNVFNTSDQHTSHGPILNQTEVRGGGIIMLGPVPIIIGSDSKSTRILVILAIALMVLYFLIFM